MVPRRDKSAWPWLLCSLGACCLLATSAFSQVVLRSLPVSCAPLGDGLGRFHAGRFHWTIEGATNADLLSVVLPRTVDANGDGRRELVLAAYRLREDTPERVKVWALSFDAPGETPKVAWSWGGVVPIAGFNFELVSGDFNGDGFSDLIFDMAKWKTMSLFEGSREGWPHSPRTLLEHRGTAGRNLLVADVNRDGCDDLLVGISGWNRTTGRIDLYLGSSKGLSDISAWHTEGKAAQDGLGGTLCVLDANGDGQLDLAVGGRINAKATGFVRLFLGTNSSFATQAAWDYAGPEMGCDFGLGLSALGDLNKDGRQELIVGAPGVRSSNGWPGMAFVFYGSPGGLESQPRWTARGSVPASLFGRSVCGVGDINGDGWPDLAVGMPGQKTNTKHDGCVRLYLGGPDGLATNESWSAAATHATTTTGAQIAALGDLNGDGFDDFAVVSPTWWSTESYLQRLGRVDIFFGHTNAYASGSKFRPDGINALTPSERSNYLIGQQPQARVRADSLQSLLNKKELEQEVMTNEFAARLSETEQRRQVETNRLTSLVERERRATTTRMKRLALSVAVVTPVVLAAVALLWIRQRRRVARASTEQERERLARDLHEGLGSGVNRLQRLTELLDGLDPASEEARRYREDLRRTSQELGGTLDDAIWAVKPENDTLENLVDFLANQAPSILEPHGVSCELDLPELPAVVLTGDTRQHVSLAVKEGLNNVAKHAKANRAWLRVAWSAPWLEIVVEDDGCGIQSSAPRPNGVVGGNGLRNLQARMQALGGTSTLTARETGGTRLVLRVPLARVG